MYNFNSIEEMYEKFVELRIELDRICALETEFNMALNKVGIVDQLKTLGRFLERNGYDIVEFNRKWEKGEITREST